MCRSARQPGGECRTPAGVRAAWLIVLLLVPAVPAMAQGPDPGGDPGSDNDRRVMGEMVDVTGLMERPRGDTTLPWSPPGGFGSAPDVPFGRALRDEILTPVDRNELKRLLEVERSLGR
jgi:hypothetical protein